MKKTYLLLGKPESCFILHIPILMENTNILKLECQQF